jgi:hypothetical protein
MDVAHVNPPQDSPDPPDHHRGASREETDASCDALDSDESSLPSNSSSGSQSTYWTRKNHPSINTNEASSGLSEDLGQESVGTLFSDAALKELGSIVQIGRDILMELTKRSHTVIPDPKQTAGQPAESPVSPKYDFTDMYNKVLLDVKSSDFEENRFVGDTSAHLTFARVNEIVSVLEVYMPKLIDTKSKMVEKKMNRLWDFDLSPAAIRKSFEATHCLRVLCLSEKG